MRNKQVKRIRSQVRKAFPTSPYAEYDYILEEHMKNDIKALGGLEAATNVLGYTPVVAKLTQDSIKKLVKEGKNAYKNKV